MEGPKRTWVCSAAEKAEMKMPEATNDDEGHATSALEMTKKGGLSIRRFYDFMFMNKLL